MNNRVLERIVEDGACLREVTQEGTLAKGWDYGGTCVGMKDGAERLTTKRGENAATATTHEDINKRRRL